MAIKQRTYEGYGIQSMLNTAFYYHLTKENSDLKVDDYNDPNSHWTIKVKSGFMADIY